MIKLSPRLLDITKHLDFTEKILDVGCDHGKLAIYLIQNNYYQTINISDNKQSALNYAINNINKYNLKAKIIYHLGEGIDFIDNLDIDTLVISGLGTNTIINILSHSNLNKINKLIIQANNNHYLLRKKIIEYGFKLTNETVIKDNKHYYITMSFSRGKGALSRLELEFGIHNNLEYLNNTLNKYYNLLNNPLVNAQEKEKINNQINKIKGFIKTIGGKND